jgi:hypothetical protein
MRRSLKVSSAVRRRSTWRAVMVAALIVGGASGCSSNSTVDHTDGRAQPGEGGTSGTGAGGHPMGGATAGAGSGGAAGACSRPPPTPIPPYVCGAAGQRCCNDGTCTEAGTECSIGVCTRCGGPGERCCADESCSGGACCVSFTCVAAGASCGGSYGQCQNGHCTGCGALAQPCCGKPNTGICNSPRLSCENAADGGQDQGTCVSCGGPGESCCDPFRCGEGYICDTTHGVVCVPCGNTGGACCPDARRCKDETACCSDGKCVPEGDSCFQQIVSVGNQDGICRSGTCACGGDHEPCCLTGKACVDDAQACDTERSPPLCGHCGAPGEPCCANNICANGGCCVPNFQDSTCVAESSSCGGSSVCKAGSCGSCGGRSQPCCMQPHDSFPAFCSASNTSCSGTGGGTCGACGGRDEPCCPGNDNGTCSPGLSCQLTAFANACVLRCEP